MEVLKGETHDYPGLIEAESARFGERFAQLFLRFAVLKFSLVSSLPSRQAACSASTLSGIQ